MHLDFSPVGNPSRAQPDRYAAVAEKFLGAAAFTPVHRKTLRDAVGESARIMRSQEVH